MEREGSDWKERGQIGQREKGRENTKREIVMLTKRKGGVRGRQQGCEGRSRRNKMEVRAIFLSLIPLG